MENDLKICTKCNEEKYIDDFGFTSKGGKKYRRNICKPCTNKQKNENKKRKKDISTQENKKPVKTQNTINAAQIKKENVYNMFDKSEIETLKNLIKDYPEVKKIIKNKNTNTDIDTNILGIKTDRTKQTYTIQNNLIKEIEQYCKVKRISKSDFINIAIIKALEQ